MTITLRKPEEIQRAHDVLAALVLDEAMFRSVVTTLEEMQALLMALNCLCWVLDHSHNPTFGALIERVEQTLAERGIYIVDSGRLMPGRKPQ